MRMTADNYLETLSDRIYGELVQIVHHVNPDRPDLRHLRVGNRVGPIAFVIVSANRHDRRKRSQLFQHFPGIDIARVKNEVGARERIDGFRSQQTMCVRDQADDLLRHPPYLPHQPFLPYLPYQPTYSTILYKRSSSGPPDMGCNVSRYCLVCVAAACALRALSLCQPSTIVK